MKTKKISFPKFDLDAVLKLLFYLLALVTIITYFIYRERYPTAFIYVGFSAIAVRLFHYIIIFLRKK